MPKKMNDGGPAFPRPNCSHSDGMSLRDWFAGQVIAGGWCVPSQSDDPLSIAKNAYRLADKLLEARKG